jgi:phosphodiesterase/alkaline phosphatase D-like protein
MPSPGSERSGYEARFTGVNGSASNYKVELSKWASGTRTVLATKEGFSLPVGTTMALTEAGGSLVLWTGTSSLSTVLSASDSTYSSGYAGVEANKGAGTEYNFRAGNFDTQAPDTSITSGPSGTVAPTVSFSFTGTEPGTFECSMDGGAYASCASPKEYQGLSSGSHTFRVRAVDSVGNQDPSPAERSFTVAVPPTVTTGAASSVKSTQATLGGSVNPHGLSTTYQFEYGTSTSYGSTAPATPKSAGSGNSTVELTEPITGLSPDTAYHFRLSATNASGTSHGEDRTFRTIAVPVATTEAATGVEALAATLNAIVNPKGDATTYQFEYGTTEAYGSKVPATPKAAGSDFNGAAVSEGVTGLTEGTVYHYRVVATNSVGTVHGSDRTFTTPYLPYVETETPEAVAANEAVVAGSVDPNGSESEYQFEYGKTASYGSLAPPSPEEAGDGQVAAEAGEALAELEPETTYHYRIVATGEAGRVVGEDRTFTTGPRVFSKQHEEEQAEEEEHFTAKFSSQPNSQFIGLMCCGDKLKEQPNIIKHSGAGMFRLFVGLHDDENKIETLMRQWANRGITALPYFSLGWPGGSQQQQEWADYIKYMVGKYGPNGSFWAPGGGYSAPCPSTCTTPRPATWWEIGNEPNLGKNTPSPNDPYTNNNNAKVKEYGEIFSKMSAAAKAAGNVNVLLSALFTTGATGCGQQECHMSAEDFIKAMGHYASYDAVSIHPYAFKVNGHAPQNDADVKLLRKKVRANIAGVRAALVGENQGKNIWVTELGFPTASNSSTFPPVTQTIQGKLIASTFNMMKAAHEELGISHAFYYNIADSAGNPPEWDWHCGLLTGGGKIKDAPWEAFAEQAGGDPHWRPKAKVEHKGTSTRPKAATSSAVLNPYGMSTRYWVKWAEGPDTEPEQYDHFSEAQDGGFEEEDEEVQSLMTGLNPKTKYHYRVVAENDDEEKTLSPDVEFETSPFVSSDVKRVLHGQPGWAWIDGWEPEVTGATLNVVFQKESGGSWETVSEKTQHPTVAADGTYNTGYVPLGKGHWQVKTVFPAQSGFPQYESGWHDFYVRDGVQIVAKHSGECWDIEHSWTADGVPVKQYPCGNPATSENQVFTLRPTGEEAGFEIVARHSGKCLDIAEGSQSNGAHLIQWPCVTGAAEQRFTEAWWGESQYAAYVAKHSGKCLDVENASQGWVNILQWTCTGLDNQAFHLEPVESAPIPTELGLTIDQVLHGSPGMVSIHGHLLAGAYSMANRIVHVEFDNANTTGWDTSGGNIAIPVDANGYYEYRDWGIEPGHWNVRARFVGDSQFAESVTEPQNRTVKRGYYFVNRHSGKCLTLSEDRNVNGQALIQWKCGEPPSNGNGQVFSFWPMGGGWYELRINGTNRCVDVPGASTTNGAYLQLWDCLGGNNQQWERVPIENQPPFYGLIVRHDSKCMDDLGESLVEGAHIGQWDCNWHGNQQWELNGVIEP